VAGSDNKFRDIYLVVRHTQVPAKGEKTHTKDWKKTGKWNVFEDVVVTDSLKNKLVNDASIMINVTKSKVEKNRFREEPNGDDKSIYLSYMQKYQESIVKFYVKFRPQILDEMLEQKNKKEITLENNEVKLETSASAETKIETTAEPLVAETLVVEHDEPISE
jgi:hypothetical protein